MVQIKLNGELLLVEFERKSDAEYFVKEYTKKWRNKPIIEYIGEDE